MSRCFCISISRTSAWVPFSRTGDLVRSYLSFSEIFGVLIVASSTGISLHFLAAIIGHKC